MSIRDSFNKINKHVRNIILILLGLILLIWVFIFFLIKSPKFQSFLVHQTATFLSDKFHAEVKVDRVELVFFKTAAIHHVLIRDQHRDTLAYIEKLNVGISLFSIIKKKLFFNDIQLINPRIHLIRNSRDSVFNYDFLLSKNKSKEQLTGTYWQIDLKNLQINQAEFIFLDSLKQTYLSTKIARLEVDVDKFDIEKEIIFGDVHLTEPKIEFSEFNDHTNPDTSLFSLTFPFEFSADNVRISDGTFKYNNIAFQPQPRQFDINRLSLTKIELDIDDVVQMNNVLDAHIKTLSTREKSGIEIKSLRTKFSLADNHVYLNNLDLKTNRSEIKNSIKLNFKRFRDFNANIANVLIDAHLDQTKISGTDLAYFPIKIDSFFKHEVFISGHIKGRLSNIQAKQLNLSIDKNIFIEGNVSAIGLPKMDQTVFDADFTRVEANIANIAAFLPPSVKLPEPITKVGNFKFVGNFKGKYNDFKSKFALATDIGKVNADIETKFNPEIKRLTYKGNVQGDNIQMGVLTNQTNLLGAAKFDIAVNGQGMKLEDINSHVKGTIQEFGFKGYSYKNIELNGDVVSKEFNGSIAINDPNAQLDLKGTVSLKDSIPDFKLIANVRKVNFQEIKLINKPWVVKSLINVNFKGKNLDNLIGEINLDNFELVDLTNYRTYNIEFLSLNSEINGKNRSIILFSDISNLELNGMFKFKDLPIIVNNYFLYFFNEKNQVEKLEQAANFTFDISLENSKKIIPLFLPDFKDIDQANFTGNFNSNSRAMNIKGEFNKLAYGNFAIPKILLSANSNSSTFNFNLKADSLFKKDSLFLTPILLAGHYKDNSLRFNVKVNNEKNPTRLNLMADLKGISKGFNLHATSSQIVTNNKSWSINPKHEITFQDGILNVKDFVVSHKTEQIKIHTDINDNRETDLFLNISKVNLNDITSSLIKGNLKFYGLINGKVEVKNVFKNPAPIANFQIEKIVINRDTVGNLIVESKWDEHEGKVILKSSIIGKFQDINIDGFYKANKTKTDEINVDVSINQLTPNVLDNFVSEYMYNNKGKLSGKLNLHGPISKPILTGFVNINTLQTTVNFLHTTYFLKNQIARFTEKGIVLDGVTLTDRFGNTAYGGGTIYHEGLKKFYLDVFVKTARIECIRTNYQQNPDFWGNVFANATAKFKGAADALIDIDVAGKAIEGSDMSIMLNSNKETEKYSFLNFRNKVTAPKEKPKNIAVKKTGINMDIDIEVTRACKLHVRFDPATEDKINAEEREM
ncbi:MAG: hypothetical protein IPK03_13500 [Bacteroidetes bacterium]|nr:hypothetical protein [Bacteroidota bacterium]